MLDIRTTLQSDEAFIAQVQSHRLHDDDFNLDNKDQWREKAKVGANAIIDLFSVFNATGTVDVEVESNRELLALVLGSLTSIQVRDFALGSPTEDTLDKYVSLFEHILLHAPVGYCAPSATLLAAFLYQRGGVGTTQDTPMDLLMVARADDENYSLTTLLVRVFSAGWPADSFNQMRKELHPKVCETIYGSPAHVE